jgi:hypothetical protein
MTILTKLVIKWQVLTSLPKSKIENITQNEGGFKLKMLIDAEKSCETQNQYTDWNVVQNGTPVSIVVLEWQLNYFLNYYII